MLTLLCTEDRKTLISSSLLLVRSSAVVTDAIKTHYPKLYWDNMEQIFPHWSSIVNDGGTQFNPFR